ncbi:MAG TPA: hypothetical protein VMD92_04700 [Acidobacteriaceae bacterium]|jgi:hypothetical protein|nr:hypothetical protein [Acidobacteriaceae bacterium]
MLYHEPMALLRNCIFCLCRKKKAAVTEFENREPAPSSRALRAVGWTSVALGITALGLYIGHELRVRYQFNRRTPTDFYSHAGEEMSAEYGMGI